MALEKAKCLISNESLIPVMLITGSNGSLLADLIAGSTKILLDPAILRHGATAYALAQFHINNSGRNENGF